MERRSAQRLLVALLALVLLCCCVIAASEKSATSSDPLLSTLKMYMHAAEADQQGVLWGTFLASNRARGGTAPVEGGGAPGQTEGMDTPSHLTGTPSGERVVRATAAHSRTPPVTGDGELRRISAAAASARSNSVGRIERVLPGQEWSTDSSLSSDTTEDSEAGGGGPGEDSSTSRRGATGDTGDQSITEPSQMGSARRRSGRYVVVTAREMGSARTSIPSSSTPTTSRSTSRRQMQDTRLGIADKKSSEDGHDVGSSSHEPSAHDSVSASSSASRSSLREELQSALAGLLHAADTATPSLPGSKASTPSYDGDDSDGDDSSEDEKSEWRYGFSEEQTGDKSSDDSSSASNPTDAAVAAAMEPEMHYIDGQHMLLYVPTTVSSMVLPNSADYGKWKVYDIFQSPAAQALKLAPNLRSLAHGFNNEVSSCRARFAQSVSRGHTGMCAASNTTNTTTRAASSPPGGDTDESVFPHSPLRISAFVAHGEATNVVVDLTTGDRLSDIELAADDAAGVGSSVSDAAAAWSVTSISSSSTVSSADRDGSSDEEQSDVSPPAPPMSSAGASESPGDTVDPAALRPHQCKAFFTVTGSSTVEVELYFKDCPDTAAATAATPGPCECLRLLSAIVAHPSVRWVETSATVAQPLNYRAAATVQSGCDADILPSTESESESEAAAQEAAERSAVAHPMWAMGIDGAGEVIAITDGGLDMGSCYFADPTQSIALYPDVNTAHRKIVSVYTSESIKMNIVGGGTTPAVSGVSLGVPDNDGMSTVAATKAWDVAGGHGTHVAGSAAGSPYRGECEKCADRGAAQCEGNQGVAPGAKLFIRILDNATTAGGSNTESTSTNLQLPRDIAEVFAPAYAAAARISSNSWGFPPTTAGVYTAIERHVDRYAYKHDDLLILLAAGNSPRKGLFSPGAAKNVLTVGAHLNSFDETQQNTVAAFSSHGPTYDHRRKPEVVGPGGGGGVRSACASGLANVSQCSLTSKKGTSMATALLAGAGALARQFARERLGFASPSSALLKAMLIHATVRLPRADPNTTGFGRVDLSLVLGDVAAATASVTPSLRVVRTKHHGNTVWIQDRLTIHDRSTQTFCFTATPAAAAAAETDAGSSGANKTESLTLKATLLWNDPATAVEGSERSLVHDLDLVVVDADGGIYYPHPTDPSIVFLDRDNNVEMVRVPRVTAALGRLFRVIVYGNDVQEATDGQQYSLIVSAPGLVVKEDCTAAIEEVVAASAAPVFCPGNCTGKNGRCQSETGECLCVTGFRFADCSLCDEVAFCSRHGTCDQRTLTCTCRAGSHFSDAQCSVCEEGWYGPLCDSSCDCKNGGLCDVVTGVCSCPQDFNYGGSGCYQGGSCQYCCEGFAGTDCNKRSYWCDDTDDAVTLVDDADGGYIQVNGYDAYPYSATCRWNISALPHHRVQLEYIKYDIEDPYDFLFLFDFSRNTSSSSSSAAAAGSAAAASPSGSPDQYMVRRDNGVLDEKNAFTVESRSRNFFLLFQSDWAEVREGFLLHYTFLPVSRCTQAFVSPFPLVTPDALTCGEAIGLMDWCVCGRPYVGWYCNITGLSPAEKAGTVTPSARRHNAIAAAANAGQVSAVVGSPDVAAATKRSGNTTRPATATRAKGSAETISPLRSMWGQTERNMVLLNPGDDLRPTNSYFVSESVIALNELPASGAEESVQVGIQSIARVPLVVNGYTLLKVQSYYNTTSSPVYSPPLPGDNATNSAKTVTDNDKDEDDREWIVELLIVPFVGSDTWVTDVAGLRLGVAYVNALRPDLLTSNLSKMQLIDLYNCPENPTPSFKAPLRIPANMRKPGGTSIVQFEAQILLTLLWSPLQEVPPSLLPHRYLDTAVIATYANYTHPLPEQGGSSNGSSKGGGSGSGSGVSADLGLQCRDVTVQVPIGAGFRVTEPTTSSEQYVREGTMTAYQFVLVVLASSVCGAAVGVVSVRRQLRRTRGSGGGSERPMLESNSTTTIPLTTTTSSSARAATSTSDASSGNSARHSDEDGSGPMLGDDLVSLRAHAAAGHTRHHNRYGASQMVSRSRKGIRGMFRSFGGGTTRAVTATNAATSSTPPAAWTMPTSNNEGGTGSAGYSSPPAGPDTGDNAAARQRRPLFSSEHDNPPVPRTHRCWRNAFDRPRLTREEADSGTTGDETEMMPRYAPRGWGESGTVPPTAMVARSAWDDGDTSTFGSFADASKKDM